MITYYLGDKEVEGYARDLARRLVEHSFPNVWITLGRSGSKLADVVADFLLEEHQQELRVIRSITNRATKAVTFLDSFDSRDLTSAHVLVIDSAIYSGASMLAGLRAPRPYWCKKRHILFPCFEEGF